MRFWLIGLAMLVGSASAAAAQAPPAAGTDQVRARQRIFMMEGALERAVQLGVDNLRRRMRAVMPDDALLQGGAPQVRGFHLDGYGVFFDVEVPAVRRSFAWSLRTMNETGMALARDLAQMRAFMQAIADERMRMEFDRMLQRIQRQMAPAAPAAERAAVQNQAGVTAQSIPPSPAPPADPLLLSNPGEAYTQEVKTALVDAMIENSGALMLGDDEWLTVAARDNTPGNALVPGDQDVVTLILRVKGSDLNAFRAGRLTLDQVKARVAASEF
ncbi:MAG: hypothetical protein HYY76_05970 [Acidobacteria bacterium]|nr:hypothetical protein [Acidobacteriota bacterium]